VEFGWSAAEAAYRSAIRDSLRRIVPPDRGRYRASLEHSAEASRAVCERLAESGDLVPHWPIEWGGSAASAWRQVILGEEMWRVGEPRAPQYLNINFIGPAISRFGTEDQRQRFLPRIAAGQALWCQGFSEPDAGSDLSRIRTTATPVEGGYVVRGVKLWISYADVAEHCFLLARVPTVVDAARGDKRRRTLFLVDMDSPGITVKEIASVIGRHVFHEVRFDDVFVATNRRLGEAGQGWAVVRAALADERASAPEYRQAEAALDAALAASDAEDAAVGEAYLRCAGARLLAYEIVSQQRDGKSSPVASQARAYLHRARRATGEALEQRLADTGLDAWTEGVELLNGVISGVAGGAYEVLLDASTRWRAKEG
jgi:alkylation response protein AidB-like acyl-CoA dehydrogenase